MERIEASLNLPGVGGFGDVLLRHYNVSYFLWVEKLFQELGS